MEGEYNYYLVILSYIIAVLASYVALDMAGRLRSEPSNKGKLFWLIGGAFSMGAGIWSMHFIGMLAFIMPMHMSYNLFLTISSLIVAQLASLVALFLLRKGHLSWPIMIGGGLLIGAGMASMHYLGMDAMNDVKIVYKPLMFFLSLLIAFVASVAALWLALRVNEGKIGRQVLYKALAALVMGAAICGMHYTGMAAAVFYALPDIPDTPTDIQQGTLAYYIAAISSLIIGIALMTSTHKQLVVKAIQGEKDFLNAILNNLEDGIVACNAGGRITLLNKAMRNMTGQPNQENELKYWTSYCRFFYPNGHEVKPEEIPINLALNGERVNGKEYILRTDQFQEKNVVIDGQPIVDLEAKTVGAVIAVHDVTVRKQMENQLIRQATHDMLTDLPNRALLTDRLEQAIQHAKRNSTKTALLFVDVDHFKLINDNFGHAAGDELLLIVAKRLQSSIRESDTVARLGGDEFVVLLSNLENEESLIALSHKILHALSAPMLLTKVSQAFSKAKQRTKITASIGVSIYPKNGSTADELLKYADIAMYRVKSQGRNNVQFYSEEMNIRTAKRLELEAHLYDALDNEQFLLHYQPILDLKSGFVIGFEALLRWQHPTMGLLMPGDFIPLLEESGLIVPVGKWVLETACGQTKKWEDMGLRQVRIAVNVSGRQINDADLAETVKEVLNKTRLDPKWLELELTESAILEYPQRSFDALKGIKELGIHIALDDFGTGYSSLGYLSRLPVSKLKIDRSFVHNIEEGSDNAAIVMAIINLASSMKLKVTAEGMETEHELKFLRFNQCDEVQGYFFSKPLTVDEATQLLRENPKLEAIIAEVTP